MAKRQPAADRFSTTAKQLAQAAWKIAGANHYMVGFDPEATKDISLADYQDANSYMVDLENKVMSHPESTRYGDAARSHPIAKIRFNLAFQVLAVACKRAHNFKLSH